MSLLIYFDKPLKGVMKSRGELILFADADGASRFSDFSKLEDRVVKNCETLEV
jgi:hypothetical protein